MSEQKTEAPRHLTTYHLTALRHGAGAVVESLRDVPESEMLRAERAGILNWLLAGFLDWQRDGFAEPPEVTAATLTYRIEQPVTPFCEMAMRQGSDGR